MVDDSKVHIDIKLSDSDISKLFNDDDDFFDDIEVDEDLTERQIKHRIVFATFMNYLFFVLFLGSILAFPYEIIMDSNFGLGKAFLLVFWGGTCLLFSSGVASSRKKLKRRLRELMKQSFTSKSATAPKAP